MGFFIGLLITLVGAVAATVALYSQRDFTLPGYAGKGGWGTLLVAALVGLTALWGLGVALDVAIFDLIQQQLTFGLGYGSVGLKAGVGMMYGAIAFLACVAAYNTYKHGHAVM